MVGLHRRGGKALASQASGFGGARLDDGDAGNVSQERRACTERPRQMFGKEREGERSKHVNRAAARWDSPTLSPLPRCNVPLSWVTFQPGTP